MLTEMRQRLLPCMASAKLRLLFGENKACGTHRVRRLLAAMAIDDANARHRYRLRKQWSPRKRLKHFGRAECMCIRLPWPAARMTTLTGIRKLSHNRPFHSLPAQAVRHPERVL